MKGMFSRLLVSAVLVLAMMVPPRDSMAQTQVDCAGPDVLALLFDNGDINITVPVNTVFIMYAVILHPTDVSGVAGIEFSLNMSSNVGIVLVEPLGPTAWGPTNPDLTMGFGTPIPVVRSSAYVIRFYLAIMDSQPGTISLVPGSVPSIPGRMAYVGAANSNLIPLDPISRDYALPVVQINSTPPLDYCMPNRAIVVDLSFDGDNANVAGTAIGATDGYDALYDVPDLDTSLTFMHPSWGQLSSSFSEDIKADYDPTRALKQWTFVVNAQGNQSTDRTAILDLQANFGVQPGVVFELFDQTTGTTFDLYNQSTFTFVVPAYGVFNRTFDLSIGHAGPYQPDIWVDVSATVGALTESPIRLSTASQATDGYDPGLDIPEPIHAPAHYVSSSFRQTTWPLGPRFSTDVRALYPIDAANKVWDLRVETDQTGTVVLNFGASFTALDSIGLQLHDVQSGQTFNLFPQMNYTFQSTGVATHDFTIRVGAGAPPPLFPASQPVVAGWNLVGLPLMPASRSLGEVILNQTPGYGYLFSYLSGQGYVLHDPVDPAEQTVGYWLASDTAFDWTMTGAQNMAPQTIALTTGWNLVGYPLWFSGPFEGMDVIHNGVTMPWLDAIAAGLVATGVQSFDPLTGSYFDAVDLEPWQGYWINALQPNLQLVFQWGRFVSLPLRLTAAKFGEPVSSQSWFTELSLVDRSNRKSAVTLAINPHATSGFDPIYDMPMAPTPPSGGPELAINHPEWNLASGAYFARDVVPPSEGEIIWNLRARLDAPGPATLQWDSSKWLGMTDYQLYLPTENRVIVMSMRRTSSVQIEVGSEPLPVIFRTATTASGVGDLPVLNYQVKVFPNPFNPMTTIEFGLPQPGDVELRIYNLRGELVNVLGAQHYDVGMHEVMWKGNDRDGHHVPSGSYFARLVVDGTVMGTVSKLSLIR